jgi:predicted XRE-type DNA-binding protein
MPKKKSIKTKKKESKVLEMHIEGKSQTAIAKAVGVTQGRVSQILSDDDIKAELDSVHRMYASKAQEIGKGFLELCGDTEDKSIMLNAIKEYHKIMGISPSNQSNTFIANIYQQNSAIPQESLKMLGQFFAGQDNIIDLLPGGG